MGILVIEILAVYLLNLPLSSGLADEMSLKNNLDIQLKNLTTKGQSKSSGNDINANIILPAQMGSESVINRLDQLAVTNSVRVTQISQDVPRKTGNMDGQDINLLVQGSKDSLLNFISEIEKEPRFIRLTSWQIFTEDGSLKVTLKLTIYALSV